MSIAWTNLVQYVDTDRMGEAHPKRTPIEPAGLHKRPTYEPYITVARGSTSFQIRSFLSTQAVHTY